MPIAAILRKAFGKYHLSVGSTSLGEFSSVQEAKAFLKGKYGASFKPSPQSKGVTAYYGKAKSSNLPFAVMVRPIQTMKSGVGRRKNTTVTPKIHKTKLPSSVKALACLASKIQEYLRDDETMGVVAKYERQAVNAGASWNDVEKLWNKIKARKSKASNVGRRKNISQGITKGTGRKRRFFPIRSSSDYDPTLLKGAEGQRARSKKRKKKAVSMRLKARKTVKKTAKKTAKKNPKAQIYKIQAVSHPQHGKGTRILAAGGLTLWGPWSKAKALAKFGQYFDGTPTFKGTYWNGKAVV